VSRESYAHGADELELRLARLELTLLEVMTAVGMLVGELALRDDLALSTAGTVENALEHGWQDLVGARAARETFGVTIAARAVSDFLGTGRSALERAVTDAGAAVGALYDVRGGEGRLVAAIGYPDDVIDGFAHFPLTADLPAATAVRTRRPIWFGRREQILDQYPHLQTAHEETEAKMGADNVQGAVVPLVAAGEVVAVAIIGFATGEASPDASRLEAVRRRLAASFSPD
jgi:GAF domain